ncbi:MAG: hypothetical protein VKJ06_09325 [Vampirovibrionales bacterium]|nr:hypothetical protein [Vampirovibrionales bacterium]
MQIFSYFNHTGGMNAAQNDAALSDREAELIVNLQPANDGTWSTNNVGYKRLNAVPLAEGAPIDGMHAFKGQLIAASGGKLYSLTVGSGVVTELYTGLTPGQRVRFLTFQGFLMMFDGASAPLRWDGINAVEPLPGWPPAILGFAPGAPGFGAIYSNRLCLAGDAQNPSALYISAIEDPTAFEPGSLPESAGLIQIAPGDGQKITALKPLFLPLDSIEVLVIFKERAIYMLQGQDGDTFTVQKISDSSGAAGPDAVVTLGGTLLFLDESGVSAFSTEGAQGALQQGLGGALSKSISALLQRLNRSALGNAFALHDAAREQLWWVVPDGSASRNNRVLVQHVALRAQQPAWSLREGFEARCGVVLNETLYTGDYAGQIYIQQRGNTYEAAAIAWKYRTPFYTLGNPRTRKRIREVQVYCKQIAQVDLMIESAWDYRRAASRRHRQFVRVTPDAASAVYGSARYGENNYNESGSSLIRFTPPGSGQALQLTFYGTSADPPVALQGWQILSIDGGVR